MLARFARTAIRSGRYFTTKPTGAAAPAAKEMTEAEELDAINVNAQSPEFKDAILKSRQQYKEIVTKLTSEDSGISQATGVRPTIFINTASGKIAHAIFDAAASMRSIGIVAKELAQVKQIIEQTPGFKFALEGEVEASEKTTMLELLTNSLELSPVSGFFLYYMTYERNFNLITPALNDFKRLVGSLDTEMSIRLTVAHEYNAGEKQDLEKNVKTFFPPETVFKFSYVVDPSIQKGYIIESPFINHDASLATVVKEVQAEEKSILAEFLTEIKKGINSETPVWESKDFRDKYLTFDEKAYEAKLN